MRSISILEFTKRKNSYRGIGKFGAVQPGRGYYHYDLTGGSSQSQRVPKQNFEKYSTMVVSFYRNPQMVVHEPEN